MQPVRSIIVVDDDEGVRDATSALLTLLGHNVEVARDIPQATDLLRIQSPDILICDYMLGSQTATDLTSVREFRDVHIRVLHTAHEAESLTKGTAEQFTAVVAKIDGVAALLDAIEDDR